MTISVAVEPVRMRAGAVPTRPPLAHNRLANAMAFIVALVASVALHWTWLNYGAPFGGQQSDDDYHYYSFAARLDAADPFDLQAYQADVLPDQAMHQYDIARTKISFSRFWPYPAWAWMMHQASRLLGLSYPMAAFLLFILQSGLLIYGVQLLAATMAPARTAHWWRAGAGLAAAVFVGVDGVASSLLSIPMNMAIGLSMAALGTAVWGRWRMATGWLVLAAIVHMAAITLAAYVIFTALIYGCLTQPRRAWKGMRASAIASGFIVVAVWAAVHFGLLGMGETGLKDPAWFGFDRARLSFLARGTHGFFPIVGTAGMVACWCAIRAGQASWRLPVACLFGIALTGIGFLFIGNQHVNHLATLHPLSRFLFYMAPGLLVLMTLLAAASALISGTSALVRSAALASVLVVVVSIVVQNRLVAAHQFSPRITRGLGPLHERLSQFARDAALPATGFLFYSHEFGTVLSAAHLYDGRYLWTKVYSPEQLQEATRRCQRLVYLEGNPKDEVPFRVPGFCPVSDEVVQLGIRPGQPGGSVVHVIQAERC